MSVFSQIVPFVCHAVSLELAAVECDTPTVQFPCSFRGICVELRDKNEAEWKEPRVVMSSWQRRRR